MPWGIMPIYQINILEEMTFGNIYNLKALCEAYETYLVSIVSPFNHGDLYSAGAKFSW